MPEYDLRTPLVAMKVAKPYKAVAEWCDGEVVRRYGNGSTVLGVRVNGEYGEKLMAKVGDYIVVDLNSPGYTIMGAEIFEKQFIERRRSNDP